MEFIQNYFRNKLPKIPELQYKVLEKEGDFEIREYPENIPYIYAYTISPEEFQGQK